MWFANLITYSEALTLAGVYVPFTEIGAAVLRMLADTRGITLAEDDAAELTDRFASMPPHPSVAGALALDPGDVCLVAGHVWDTLGALAAGWQAGLILRSDNAPLPVGPQPTYIGNDLAEIADQLIARQPG